MKKLNISKDLSMPTVTATQKLAWLGTTGSGKTYGASKLAEELFSAGAQFIVLDPVGVWWGLRLQKDGKKPSNIDIPIFGGLHGDIPLESTAGELMANLVVDQGLSCVIDVSQFESDAEKARFAKDFANRFFFRKKAAPSAVHLFLEECQEFVPQNPQRGEEQMLHAFVRMQKLGRNFGIGSSYITQRPQEVNKKALNMAQTLFVFRTTGLHERKAIEQWIEDKSLDQSIAQDLPKIKTGDCHVWSPEFLKISEMIRISEKQTFNASATPEVGATAKSRKLADIDINKIRKEMEGTIEKAKTEDPKELRKEIGNLKKLLAAKNGTFIEKQVYDQKAIDRAVDENNRKWKKDTEIIIRKNRELMQILQKVGKLTYDFSGEIVVSGEIKMPVVAPIPKGGTVVYPNVPVASEEIAGDVPLSKGAKAIHDYLSSVYPAWRSKAQLWIATGYAPGGGFNNLVYELTGRDLIEKDGAGKYAAKVSSGDTFIPDLDIWYSKLSKGASAIFRILRDDSDSYYSKERLAEMTGYALGGGFNNLIYELTGKELIIKRGSMYAINPEALEI